MKYEIHMPYNLSEKMTWFTHRATEEVGGMGVCSVIRKKSNTIIRINCIDTIPCSAGLAHYTPTGDGLQAWLKEKFGESCGRGLQPSFLFWHSHVHGGVEPSDRDDTTVSTLCEYEGFVVSIITNKSDEYSCGLYATICGGQSILKIPATLSHIIPSTLDYQAEELYESEFVEKVKEDRASHYRGRQDPHRRIFLENGIYVPHEVPAPGNLKDWVESDLKCKKCGIVLNTKSGQKDGECDQCYFKPVHHFHDDDYDDFDYKGGKGHGKKYFA